MNQNKEIEKNWTEDELDYVKNLLSTQRQQIYKEVMEIVQNERDIEKVIKNLQKIFND